LHIFPARSFQLACKLIIGFIAISGLAFCLVTFFQCTPVNKSWDKGVEGRCIDVSAAGYVIAAIGIAEDLALLFLPIRELWMLKIDTNKKMGLVVMFSVGIL
jgi:hypothetical protein